MKGNLNWQFIETNLFFIFYEPMFWIDNKLKEKTNQSALKGNFQAFSFNLGKYEHPWLFHACRHNFATVSFWQIEDNFPVRFGSVRIHPFHDQKHILERLHREYHIEWGWGREKDRKKRERKRKSEKNTRGKKNEKRAIKYVK